MLELARRALALGRRKALPEKAVIPQLGAVVEQLGVARAAAFADHLRKRCAAQLAFLLDQLVGLVDVGFVVLAVVELEGFGRHVRRERILGIWQVGKLERHHHLLGIRICPLAKRCERQTAPRFVAQLAIFSVGALN